MKNLYLVKTPNDMRTWVYPDHNKVSTIVTENSIPIVESENGDVFVEAVSDHTFVRVSSQNSPLKNSLGIFRYAVVRK